MTLKATFDYAQPLFDNAYAFIVTVHENTPAREIIAERSYHRDDVVYENGQVTIDLTKLLQVNHADGPAIFSVAVADDDGLGAAVYSVAIETQFTPGPITNLNIHQ